MIEIIDWLKAHPEEVKFMIGAIEIIAAQICFIGSVIVKATPTLKDDHWFLPIVKFLSKYIAINTPTPTNRPEN